jgi:GT2 family glycosyltransferase
MMPIYILLPVHNRRAQTERFIKCLAEQTYDNYHLILIDDGSSDGTAEMVQEKISSITILKGSGNLWWAGGLQKGIDWLCKNSISDSDVVLMINDDVTFNSDFLEKGVELVCRHPRTLIHSFAIGNQTGEIANAGVKADLEKLTFEVTALNEEINCLATMGLFMRFTDLKQIGGFYPKLLPHYLSDYEFTIRARRKGVQLLASSELSLLLNEGSTGFSMSDLNHLQFPEFIKSYFSNRNNMNPIHWSFFVVLTCPKLSIPGRLISVWKAAFILISRNIAFNLSASG